VKLLAGTAKVDITPNYGSPTRRWYLGADGGRITEIRWPLYARTLALSDGETISTITSMDIACIYKCHHDRIRELVREMSPVPIGNVILHNTHQHSDSFVEYEPAYDVFGINDVAFDMDYISGLARRIASSVCLAAGAMEPVHVGSGCGAVEEGIASCRRVLTQDGRLLWRSSRPSPELRALPRGHIDPRVGVISFTAPEGRPVATLYNYACHPSAAGGDSPPVISADYPGFASHMIETCHGGTALFLHGCTGDINPAKYVRGDSLNFDDRIADARRMGRILGAEVLKTLGTIETREAGYLNVARRDCELPIKPEAADVEGSLAAAHKAIEDWKRNGADPRTALRKYVIARKITASGGCPVTMFAVAIDDDNMAFIPGEPFTAFGEEIKKAGGGGNTLVAATCGEDPFYMPTGEAIEQGGYETGYIASPETGERLVREATELLGSCARRSGA